MMIEINENILSNRIKEMMLKRGITNEDLARVLYVSANTVSGYRTGYRKPDLDKINRMADFLDVSVAYLLGYSDDPANSGFEGSANEKGFFALFFALSEYNQQMTIEYMTELLVNQMHNSTKSTKIRKTN